MSEWGAIGGKAFVEWIARQAEATQEMRRTGLRVRQITWKDGISHRVTGPVYDDLVDAGAEVQVTGWFPDGRFGRLWKVVWT